ncbi:MAG: hypothetical protein WCG07_01870 [Candidatus Taylorbacteria bacterium]
MKQYYICNGVTTLIIGAILGMLVLGLILWLKNPVNREKIANLWRLAVTYSGKALKVIGAIIGTMLILWLVCWLLLGFCRGGSWGFGSTSQTSNLQQVQKGNIIAIGGDRPITVNQYITNIVNQVIQGNTTNRCDLSNANPGSTGLNTSASTTTGNGWLAWPSQMNKNFVCVSVSDVVTHRQGTTLSLQPGQVARIPIPPGTHIEYATQDVWHIERWEGNGNVGQLYHQGLEFPQWMIEQGPCEVRFVLKPGEAARVIHVYIFPN